jgi:hypothetical protein
VVLVPAALRATNSRRGPSNPYRVLNPEHRSPSAGSGRGKGRPLILGAVAGLALLLFLAVAFLYTNNMTLMLDPRRGQARSTVTRSSRFPERRSFRSRIAPTRWRRPYAPLSTPPARRERPQFLFNRLLP